MGAARSVFVERIGRLNKLQETAFEVISSKGNCIITAPTGSGKTEAAMLPVLESACSIADLKGVFALYVTPLRALNRDMMKRLGELCGVLGINIAVRHGDTTQNERRKQAAMPPHVLITTPESIQNMLLSRRLRKSFENLRFVIVDELHELYHNKRGAQLAVALERLAELSPNFIRIGLSATIGDIGEAGRFLFNGKKYAVVESDVEKQLVVYVTMPLKPRRAHVDFEASFGVDDSAMARIEYLEDIIKSSKATLVFANTRQVVEALGSKIIYLGRLEGFSYVGIHHSSLDKDERIEIENGFKDGKINCIVATSSLELGIDIGRIDMVVQYGSPRQAGRLLQRVGRGGHREGLTSTGVIVVSGALEALEAAATVIEAKNGRLEGYTSESMALDVLANQLSSIALEYGEIKTENAYNIIRRSYVYSGLSAEKFMNVVDFCRSIGTIQLRNGAIAVGRRSRTYAIENISVIPDSRRFIVKRASTNRIISTLDERFVFTNIDEGSTFITKGVPWNVISIEDNCIMAEQSDDISAAVPDWEGEDIPVSKTIAEAAVGLIKQSTRLEGVADSEALSSIKKFSEEQNKFFMPRPEFIYIEESDDYIIVHTALGTLANEFVARAVASVFSKAGTEAQVKATPYAILVDIRYLRKPPDIRRIFLDLWKTEASSLEILEHSAAFRYKFVQIAKLFGVIEKKAVITKSRINKLVDFYKGSVVYEETLRDVKKNGVDYSTASEFLKKIKDGSTKIVQVGWGSPLSMEILRSAVSYSEFMSRTDPGNEDVAQVMKRFDGKDAQLLCTFCLFTYQEHIKISELSTKKILCRRCSSPMVCLYSDDSYNALVKRRSGQRLNAAGLDAYKHAVNEAGLVEAYGWRGVLALSMYGIGVSTAGRVLKMMRRSDAEFVKDLLVAQRAFIKNARFWKKGAESKRQR